MRPDSPEEGWANRHGFLHKSLCTHHGPLGTRFAPQAFCKRFQMIPEIKLMRFWDKVQCVTRKWQLSLSQSMHTVTVKAAISTVSSRKTYYRVLQYCNSFVKMTVCQSKTQLLIFANLQDKSPQRNFTSKSSSIKIKPFSPCRPVCGSQSAECKSCRVCKAFYSCYIHSAKTSTGRLWDPEHGWEGWLLLSQLLRLLESHQAAWGSLEGYKRSLNVTTSLCQKKGPKPALLIRLAQSARGDEQ